MAFKYNKIKSDAFDTMQFNSGLLLNTFNVTTGEIDDDDIISATTGGINATCVPSFVDLGDDVDNCPKNTKELKEIESWECKFSTTIFESSPTAVKLALGCADISGDTITPRSSVAQTDFQSIWWVGDRRDGGMIAINLINALSDGGFNLQTTDKGKGQFSISLTGHTTTSSETMVPMLFYAMGPDEDEDDDTQPAE